MFYVNAKYLARRMKIEEFVVQQTTNWTFLKKKCQACYVNLCTSLTEEQSKLIIFLNSFVTFSYCTDISYRIVYNTILSDTILLCGAETELCILSSSVYQSCLHLQKILIQPC